MLPSSRSRSLPLDVLCVTQTPPLRALTERSCDTGGGTRSIFFVISSSSLWGEWGGPWRGPNPCHGKCAIWESNNQYKILIYYIHTGHGWLFWTKKSETDGYDDYPTIHGPWTISVVLWWCLCFLRPASACAAVPALQWPLAVALDLSKANEHY